MFEINGTQIGMVLAIVGFVWSSTWFLSKQFASTLEKVYTKIEVLQSAMLTKLEYHEHHDDVRFADIQNALWEIRLKQAEKQAILTAIKGKVFDQENQNGKDENILSKK